MGGLGIRAVVFDLDDTLHDFQASERQARQRLCAELARESGRDPEELLHAYAETVAGLLPVWRQERRWARRTGLEFRMTAWGEVFGRLGLDPWQVGRVAEMHERLRRECLALFPDARPVLAALRGRYRLGLLSNGGRDTQRATAEALQIAGYFDAMLFEGEVGAGKPEPAIYRAAEGALGMAPAEILLVGDNWVDDVRGAKAAGWHTAWLNRTGRERPPGETDFEVRSLLELPLPEVDNLR